MLDTRLSPIRYSSLAGWLDDNHEVALEAFLTGAGRMVDQPYKTRLLGVDGEALAHIAVEAQRLTQTSPSSARGFFETHFVPCQILPDGEDAGFVTGYYEPVVAASTERTETFSVPLYLRPTDLVNVSDDRRPSSMHSSFRYGRQTANGITEFPDRGEIQAGCLNGLGLELAWLKCKVDAFFIHVQGSAKLQLENGSVMRVTYDAKSGHPYSSIAKILCADLSMDPSVMTADRLSKWMHSNPDALDALLAQNRSFIFFKPVLGLKPDEGPIAAAKTPLIAGRSLAVDRTLHTFGTPIWLNTKRPLPGEAEPFSRLMMAQDTGSAIVGPARGDIFVGSGQEAGTKAGRIRHVADMVVLVPKNMNI